MKIITCTSVVNLYNLNKNYKGITRLYMYIDICLHLNCFYEITNQMTIYNYENLTSYLNF